MRVLLLAPPGAGKGTQAARISDRYGVAHLSSGELLRRHIEQGTGIGREAQPYVQRGDLVPDEIVFAMMLAAVVQANADGGYVLDGFPRTVEQARQAYPVALDLGVTVQAVLCFQADDDELLRRMQRRAVQEARADDDEGVMRHRLEVFREKTLPLIEYYRDRGVLHAIDGMRPVEAVTADVFAVLDEVARGTPEA